MKSKSKLLTIMVLTMVACLSLTAFVATNVSANNPGERSYFTSSETIDVKYDVADTNGVNGIKVSLSGVKGKDKVTFDYSNYIDASKLKDGFASLSIEPSAVNTIDAEYITVTLTDVIDPSQQLSYTVAYLGAGSTWPTLCAGWVAFTDELTPRITTDWKSNALVLSGTDQFVFARNSMISKYHKLYKGDYDETGYHYVGTGKDTIFNKTSETAKLQNLVLALNGATATVNGNTVCELNNADFINWSTKKIAGTKYENLYKEGYVDSLFSSGFCKLSVSYMGIKNDTVSCHIKSLGGQTFAENEGCTVKNTSPLIKAEVKNNAVTGYDYSIPNVYSLDPFDGELTEAVNVEVLTADGVSVHSGFKPYNFTEKGNYIIRYSVINSKNESFYKDYAIKCLDTIPSTTFNENIDYQSEYCVGDVIKLPDTSVLNSTAISSKVNARVIVQIDGKVEKTFDNTDNSVYKLDKAGKYAVIVRYTNVYGVTDSFVKRFKVLATVVISAQPPVTFMAGENNHIDDFAVVNHYNGVSEDEIFRAIEIDGETVYSAKGNSTLSGSLNVTKALVKGVVTVKYKAGLSTDNYEWEQTYTVPVIEPKLISDFISVYSLTDGAFVSSANVKHESLRVVYTLNNDGGLLLPQALGGETISLTFAARTNNADASTLSLVLENFADRSKRVTYAFSKSESGKTVLTLNNKNYAVDSLFGSGADFEITWSDEYNTLVDAQGIALTDAVTKWDDGSEFGGFVNGAVIKLEAKNIGDGSVELSISKVANQSFGSYIKQDGSPDDYSDANSPIIVINGNYLEQNSNFGTAYEIFGAQAYDVLFGTKDIKISITDPDGDAVTPTSIAGKNKIILGKIGRYKIVYSSEDALGNKVLLRHNVDVCDKSAPVITVKNAPKELYAVGQTVVLEKPLVFDNLTKECQCNIFVIKSNGERRMVENSYTFTETGKYTIMYQAIDEDYNVALLTYTVYVSGGVQ